jgi:hypothetical protein
LVGPPDDAKTLDRDRRRPVSLGMVNMGSTKGERKGLRVVLRPSVVPSLLPLWLRWLC